MRKQMSALRRFFPSATGAICTPHASQRIEQALTITTLSVDFYRSTRRSGVAAKELGVAIIEREACGKYLTRHQASPGYAHAFATTIHFSFGD
jgi:hypothetical protein